MDDAQKAAARERAKNRLFDNILRLEDEAARLRAELDEQYGLIGMGGSREAKLLAQLAAAQAREAQWQEALSVIEKGACLLNMPRIKMQKVARAGLAIPADDTALREMIEKEVARRLAEAGQDVTNDASRNAALDEECEACATVCDELAQHYWRGNFSEAAGACTSAGSQIRARKAKR